MTAALLTICKAYLEKHKTAIEKGSKMAHSGYKNSAPTDTQSFLLKISHSAMNTSSLH